MVYKIEPSGSALMVILNGEATIESAVELKNVLLKAMESSDDIIINIESLTAIDLSFLQLLCSACRSCLKLGKKLSLSGKYPDFYNRMVRNAGYFRQRGCEIDSNDSCLWKRG